MGIGEVEQIQLKELGKETNRMKGEEEQLRMGSGGSNPNPLLIAFFLPQFHPIPENDRWWGKGFTDWTNVTRGRPQFEGHYQPRLPGDLGFYDLRIPEVRKAQADLARANGIHGFCYHYYWFDRKRLLHRPLDDLLETGQPDFPFCICWANEAWSRRWDGAEHEILVAQEYHEGFAKRFAEDVAPILRDRRYIRIQDRPLLIIYRLDQIPDPKHAALTMRSVFREHGLGEIFLAAVECFGLKDPIQFGFDAGIEFPPHNPTLTECDTNMPELAETGKTLDPEFQGILRDYRECARTRSIRPDLSYPRFPGVMPSWDNTARAGRRALIYHHASPQVYQEWLTRVLKSAAGQSAPYPPLVFINAWNEWAEGAHLEPDQIYGMRYLQATAEALESFRQESSLKNEGSWAYGDLLSGSPRSEDLPQVSIIIPVFNRVELTLECLRSLQSHDSGTTFEIIIVDDGSTDATPDLIAKIPWVRLVRRDKNRGFGSACNLGAKEARGEYLVFLNNDTTVCDSWLDALRETFDLWPTAGLVGSKIVLMNGTLQECGGMIFRDGSAANIARGEDPSDPRYCYSRETDYVSGAAMMIRHDLFADLGGFDQRYEPAYYEDTDLAFQIRDRGLKVIVNPHAVVRHHEGGTSGIDTTKGVKRYQIINQTKFWERWKDTLQGYPCRPKDKPEPRKQGPHVLVIDWLVPHPDRDSGSPRMIGILKALRELAYHVTFASRDLSCEPGCEPPLERIGVEVLRRPYFESLEEYLILYGARIDCVLLSCRSSAALHIDTIERHCPNSRIVYDLCDLLFTHKALKSRIVSTRAERCDSSDENTELDLDLIYRSHVTFVVSKREKLAIEEILPRQDVRVLSTIFEPRPTPRPFSERSGILFIGFFRHKPSSSDAVLWFVHEVLPILDRQGLLTTFHVIGSDPPPGIRRLDSKQVKIHGFVPNPNPLFDTCRLSVAPHRFGVGGKDEITQSLALGLPCVTTNIGAKETFIEQGIDGLVADQPAQFAEQIQAAYHDETLWSTLREGGLRNVSQHFSLTRATRVLGETVQEHILGVKA